MVVPPARTSPTIRSASGYYSLIAGAMPTARSNADDEAVAFAAGYPAVVYGQSSSTLAVNVNGFFGINTVDDGGGDSIDQALPQHTEIPNGRVPLWDDYFIFRGFAHFVTYAWSGTASNRTQTLEWSVFDENNITVHFLAALYEVLPNWMTYDYLAVALNGSSATMRIESQITSQPSACSVNAPNINNGMILTFNGT